MLATVFPQLLSAQARIIGDIPYSSAQPVNPKQTLDIYVPEHATRAQVIVSFYGGALRAGDKADQKFVGRRFSREGFITVIPNYRLSPAVMHPAHVEDAAAAVAWVRNNIAKYGGDSTSIVVIGHSAGAYLTALLALDARYLAAHHMSASELRGIAPVSAFFYVDRPGVAPDRPKDVWGTDANVWRSASPGAYIRSGLPPMLLVYADGDDPWRRDQQGEFADAVTKAGNASVKTVMISGRTHNTVWSRMADGDESTSRAILDFIGSLPPSPGR